MRRVFTLTALGAGLVIGVNAPWLAAANAGSLEAGAAPGLHEAPAPQEADAYTRYELDEPGSGRFRIFYDVSAVRTGASTYFNPIRHGSVASGEAVFDAATGKPLRFKVVSGADAKIAGLTEANPQLDYIQVDLARPVPPGGGQARVRIIKTYEDVASYFQSGEDIIFSRGLGVKRNAVVLPKGYAVVSCSFPSQIEEEDDGRLKVSFINPTPGEAPVLIRATPKAFSVSPSSVKAKIVERARQTRDIVYYLRDPQTHAFDLYHDYTEDRPGETRYVNVVRSGSTVSNPSAVNLDTGVTVPAQILKGAAISSAGISDPGLPANLADAEVVVFTFPEVLQNQSIRLRMSETYIDKERYRLVGDELVFERSFGRPANAVVLPVGYILTNSAAPATVSALDDGRVRLDFINPTTDDLDVLITARRAIPAR